METTDHAEPHKDTDKILNARNTVLEDTRLSDGARMYFCWLLDATLNPDRQYYRFATKPSIAYLSVKLGRCKRSFNKWNRELAQARHIWISKVPGKNTHFFNVYHITALEPEKVGEYFALDAMWGPGNQHRGFLNARSGGRDQGGKFQKAGVGANNAPSPLVENGEIAVDFREDAPVSGTNVPLSGANPAIGNGKDVPLPMAKFTTGNGELVHLPTARPRTGQRQGRAFNKELESEIQTQNSSKSCKLSSSEAPRAVKNGEEDFLLRVGSIVGDKAMANFGGWYRNRFREDPEKAWRVHDAFAEAFRQGTIRSNAGGYFKDLWGRFASRKAVGK